MKKKVIVSLVVTALVIAMAAGVVAFLSKGGYILPGYVEWQERFLCCDGYDIVLKKKHLEVYKDTELVWKLDFDVKVQDVIITDVDKDGVSEMTVLCWKKGRYGKYKPVTETEESTSDDKIYTEHIFLYDLTPNGPEPKWMASDIGETVLGIETPNGYILRTHEEDGDVSEWMWVSWGFTKVK